jgi:hypothetical protein
MNKYRMAALAALACSVRMDAGETAFVEKQLEFVEAESYNVLYSKLKSKEFIPFDASLPEWAETWVYRSWSRSGAAALISNYADDLPRVDVGVEETPHPTHRHGIAYGYNVDEIEKSAQLNEPLDAMRATAAREEMDRHIDEIAALGIATKGILGFLNQTAVPQITVTNGDWLNETDPDKIVADLFEIEQAVITQSGEHHMPTDMIMSGPYYSKIKTTRMGDIGSLTILEYFLANAESVKTVSRWSKAATAGSGGVPMVLCYVKDPGVVRFKLAYDWKALPPEQRNLEYVVNNISKLGGTVWYRPLGAVRAIGIHA